MLFEVQGDGITLVNINSSKDIILLASAFVNTMKNIPELNDLVLHLMAGRITLEDIGVSTTTKKVSKDEDMEKAIDAIRRGQPAKEEDIPDFVKRSMKGATNE